MQSESSVLYRKKVDLSWILNWRPHHRGVDTYHCDTHTRKNGLNLKLGPFSTNFNFLMKKVSSWVKKRANKLKKSKDLEEPVANSSTSWRLELFSVTLQARPQ